MGPLYSRRCRVRTVIAISVNLAKSYQNCGSATSLCTERQRGKLGDFLPTLPSPGYSGSRSESSYCSESSTGESEPERDQPDRIIRTRQVRPDSKPRLIFGRQWIFSRPFPPLTRWNIEIYPSVSPSVRWINNIFSFHILILISRRGWLGKVVSNGFIN